MKLHQFDFFSRRLTNVFAKSWDTVQLAIDYFEEIDCGRPTKIEIIGETPLKNARGKQTLAQWLALNSSIEIELATKVVSDFYNPNFRLNQVARNPRQHLKLASAILLEPDLIVFSSAGMDPIGFKRLHKYALQNFPRSLIHIDPNPCKLCNATVECYELFPDLEIRKTTSAEFDQHEHERHADAKTLADYFARLTQRLASDARSSS